MSCQGGSSSSGDFLDLTTVSVHRHEAEWRCRFIDTCELARKNASADAASCLQVSASRALGTASVKAIPALDPESTRLPRIR